MTGTILSQKQKDRELHPIAFMSKGFSDIEHNYEIYDKEILVVIQALEEWRHFLEGTPEKFKILTDHKNLAYFCSAQHLNCCQARW